jgi:uncharacterized protein (DUF58 family)
VPLLPSRRLAAYVALAGATFIIAAPAALAANLVLLALVMVDGVALYRAPLPRIARRAPARVGLGTDFDVHNDIDGLTGRARRVAWTDDLGAGLLRVGDDVFTVDTAGDARATQRATQRAAHVYRVRAAERGPTGLGDVHLRVLGPLGLLWRRHRQSTTDRVVVQPGLTELKRHRLQALHHRRELGARRLREIGGGREFERLREYVRGDDPRRIDWKGTAKRGRAIVREYEAERSQSLLLAIDAGRLMAERFGGRERLDHALAAALVLADAALVQGDTVGAMIFADRVQLYLPPARVRLDGLAEAFASAETRAVEPDYPAAFRYLGRQLRRRSLVVLFTDVIDSRASAELLAHLGAAARRHLPLAVAIRNTELEAAAASPAAREADAYRRAAAEELLQARAVALAEVRRRGVLVADVRPEATTAETLGAYFDVKRRGLL